MLANRVHPNQVRELRVAHTDVSGDALSETDASPVAEHSRHMDDNVLAVLLV